MARFNDLTTTEFMNMLQQAVLFGSEVHAERLASMLDELETRVDLVDGETNQLRSFFDELEDTVIELVTAGPTASEPVAVEGEYDGPAWPRVKYNDTLTEATLQFHPNTPTVTVPVEDIPHMRNPQTNYPGRFPAMMPHPEIDSYTFFWSPGSTWGGINDEDTRGIRLYPHHLISIPSRYHIPLKSSGIIF